MEYKDIKIIRDRIQEYGSPLDTDKAWINHRKTRLKKTGLITIIKQLVIVSIVSSIGIFTWNYFGNNNKTQSRKASPAISEIATELNDTPITNKTEESLTENYTSTEDNAMKFNVRNGTKTSALELPIEPAPQDKNVSSTPSTRYNENSKQGFTTVTKITKDPKTRVKINSILQMTPDVV
jgi:hypothetical protein